MRSRSRAAAAGACVLVILAALAGSSPGADAAPGARFIPGASPVPGTPPGGPVGDPTSVTVGQPSIVPPPGALTAPDGIRELQAIGAQVTIDPQGRVLDVNARPGASLGSSPPDAFVQRYAAALGISAGYRTQAIGSTLMPGGDVVRRYRQEASGVPVLGGELVVVAGGDSRVRSASAETALLDPVSTTPQVSTSAAVVTGVAKAAGLSGLSPADLVGDAQLWLYDPRMIGAPGRSELRPTWWVTVRDVAGAGIASVLVDGLDGAVALAISEQETVADRIVCDLANARVDLRDQNAFSCNAYSVFGAASSTRREGGPASTSAEVNRAYSYLGATHDFYRDNYGRDSYDGRGRQIRATVRACQANLPPFSFPCPYENAFWNGYQIVFGDGYVTDDVAAHEYTHAVMDHSSQLFYAFESGAINEAISDIMGEFVDQSFSAPGEDTSKLWLIGEDLPVSSGLDPELRDMADPQRLGQPDEVRGLNWSYYGPDSPFFDNGGVHTNSGPANFAAYLIATGGTVHGQAYTGIGLSKARQLWYRVMHQLPSGADYHTLGRTLSSACLILVGHGFDRADCLNVSKITAAVGMGDWITSQCGANQVVEQPALFENFESRGDWTLDPSAWQYVPSTEIPQRYAYSGTSALYGYLAPGGGSAYAEYARDITIPPANTYSTKFLFMNLNSFSPFTSGAGLAVEYRVGNGPYQRIWSRGTGPLPGGYQPVAVQLSDALAGQTIRLRLALTSGQGPSEWLVDDLMLAGCNVTVQSEPRFFAGAIVGTSGTVTWEATTFPHMHFEVSYDPPVPGAPITLPAVIAPEVMSTNTYTISVPGLDPTRTYRVSVVLVNDWYGGRSRPATLDLVADAPPNCATAPQAAIWTPPRNRPVPIGACGPAARPRR